MDALGFRTTIRTLGVLSSLWLLSACTVEINAADAGLEACPGDDCNTPEGDGGNEPPELGPDAAIDEDIAAEDASKPERGPEVACDGVNCPCDEGFEAAPEGCVDVDECASNNGGCGPIAQCINSAGSFACMCPEDAVDVNGDGTKCAGVRKVSVGAKHTCATTLQGDLYCWGENSAGQIGDDGRQDVAAPKRIGAPRGWTDISVGHDTTCALRNGDLVCWGKPTVAGLGMGVDTSVPTHVGTNHDWTRVSVGTNHACGIRDGHVYCWGSNFNDQLGVEGRRTFYEPTLLDETLRGWSHISAGASHTCGILGDRLYCWGAEGFAAVGEGAKVGKLTEIHGTARWTSVSAGSTHTCGIDDFNLYCWGTGALGNGVIETQTLPTRVGPEGGWTAVAVGERATCGIRHTELHCWGHTSSVDQDDGARVTVLEPTRIGEERDWMSIDADAAGDTFCAVRDAKLHCWGSDHFGQLARGVQLGVTTPTQVGDASDFEHISTGPQTCGQRSGALHCWGRAYVGEQEGVGSLFSFDSAPRSFASGRWTQVSHGEYGGSCGIRGGVLHCWGKSSAVGTFFEPTPISDNTGWSDLSSGYVFGCGVASGRLLCWGENRNREIGDPPLPAVLSEPTRIGEGVTWSTISAVGSHICGIQSGALYCWGNNDFGQLGNGTTVRAGTPTQIGTLADWTDVSVGFSHTCGLRGNRLFCWGWNAYGELGVGGYQSRDVPTSIPGTWTSVSARGNHTCGLQDGELYCWGRNTDGELGDGSNAWSDVPLRIGTADDWSMVSVWGKHTCGIRSGRAYCWGNNEYGQVGTTLPWSDAPVLIEVGGR